MNIADFLNQEVTTIRLKGGNVYSVKAHEMSANVLETLMDCGQWDNYDRAIAWVKSVSLKPYRTMKFSEIEDYVFGDKEPETEEIAQQIVIDRIASLKLACM